MSGQVSVIYCPTRHDVWQVTLTFTEPLTVGQALERSGVFQDHPALNPDTLSLGIFGQTCSPERMVHPGDRIEIYRSLVFDPMQSRRRRAAHRLAQARKEKTQRQQAKKTALKDSPKRQP